MSHEFHTWIHEFLTRRCGAFRAADRNVLRRPHLNLVYLQLVLEEIGHTVANLGPCPPDELVVDNCLELRPELVVVSSVNGHGFTDGLRLIRALRAVPELAGTPVVIGGSWSPTACATSGWCAG